MNKYDASYFRCSRCGTLHRNASALEAVSGAQVCRDSVQCDATLKASRPHVNGVAK